MIWIRLDFDFVFGDGGYDVCFLFSMVIMMCRFGVGDVKILEFLLYVM